MTHHQQQGFGLTFHFPFHVYPGSISEIIAGNDFLRILGGAPVLHRSKVLVELTDEEDTLFEDLPKPISRASARREDRGSAYRQQLILNKGRQGVRISDSCSAVQVDRTSELPISSHYLYPSHEYVMPPCSAVSIECIAEKFKLRHGIYYSISSLNRAAVLDVQLPSEGPIVYYHSRDDDTIPLVLETMGGTALNKEIPCAIINRLSMKKVSSLHDVGSQRKVRVQRIILHSQPSNQFPSMKTSLSLMKLVSVHQLRIIPLKSMQQRCWK